MERNKYELQREVLARKYETILKDFEDTNDDRRIAWNCYQQIIAACEAMRDSGMENNFICCAVNKSIREQESKIDEIITRFTGKVYKGVRWLDVREELKCDRFTCGYLNDGLERGGSQVPPGTALRYAERTHQRALLVDV